MSNTMSRSLSIGQEHELILAIEKTGITPAEADAVITSRNNLLADGMVGWLREKLNPPVQIPQGLLTPVDKLVERFMTRSELRKWGFTDKDANTVAARLAGHDHAGASLPVSLGPWLDKDLRYNWQEALAWVFDTARELGLDPQDYVGNAALDFYPGSEIRGRRKLTVVGLDFQTFRNRERGIVPCEQRPNRDRWPSLEVPYFLALNPGYMKAMDGGDVPWLMAAGLVVHAGYVPCFSRLERKFCAGCNWGGSRWFSTAMVAFRELQQH